jgi:hypothetical protein
MEGAPMGGLVHDNNINKGHNKRNHLVVGKTINPIIIL